MEDRSFQQKSAQATPTPPPGEVNSCSKEAGETKAGCHLPRPSRATTRHRVQMSHSMSLPHSRNSFTWQILSHTPIQMGRLGLWGGRKPERPWTQTLELQRPNRSSESSLQGCGETNWSSLSPLRA